MSYFLLASPSECDAATVTGAPTPGGLEPSNLQTPDATEVCQFSSTSSMYVIWDFGGLGVTRNLLWLGYGTGSAGATFKLRAADTLANLTNGLHTYDSGPLPWWAGGVFLPDYATSDAVLYLGDVPVAARYWRVDFFDSSPIGGAFAVGRGYLVDAWEPTKGPRFGWRTGYIEEPDILVSQGKRRYGRAGRPRRFAEWTLKMENSVELRQRSMEIARTRGANRDVLTIEDPYATGHALQQGIVYGLMSELPGIDNADLGIYEARYRVEEL